MKSPRSLALVVRDVRRELKQERARLIAAAQHGERYRSRAMKAEQDVADWKRRFDLLLARTPQEPHK
jgi:hypothetical protein